MIAGPRYPTGRVRDTVPCQGGLNDSLQDDWETACRRSPMMRARGGAIFSESELQQTTDATLLALTP